MSDKETALKDFAELARLFREDAAAGRNVPELLAVAADAIDALLEVAKLVPEDA